EEVDRGDLRRVVLQKRAPGLRRRRASSDHVLGDGGLRDLDAELDQLTENPRWAAERILPAHPSDQGPRIGRDRWTARSALAASPGPEGLERGPVPADHGVGLDDDERVAPTTPAAEEHGPEEAIAVAKPRRLRGSPQHRELMAQREVLEHEVLASAEQR